MSDLGQARRSTLLDAAWRIPRRFPPAAERSYQQAIAVAKLQSAKFSELQASISLARLWCKQDRRGEARDLLAPIYGWFTEGFDTPVLQDAKVLLDELAA